ARLLHQAHGALAHFRGKLVCVVLAHGSHSLKSESLRKTRGDSDTNVQTGQNNLQSAKSVAQLTSALSELAKQFWEKRG
ncbi:MAG: hypothetical protein QM625_05010, partial [Ralstonia sp.]|uniref:hypothetical protein n=1 Tax=Ralstonia sp. TaxID=54061 RepID=UPI0039E3FFEF